MDRQQLSDRLDRAWAALQESFAGLSGAQMAQPGVMGGWSVKDILAHVTTWEEEALKYLPLILEGGRPPRYSTLYGGIDAFNAQMSAHKQNLALAEVLRQLEDVHSRLVDYVQAAPAEQFATDTRFRHRLRLDTYSHYPVHARAILAWREGSGPGG